MFITNNSGKLPQRIALEKRYTSRRHAFSAPNLYGFARFCYPYARQVLFFSGDRMISLVTGGTGFLGSNLCVRLLREGRRVICLDNNYTGRMVNVVELRGNANFRFCPAAPPAYRGRHSIDTTRTCVLGALNMLDGTHRYLNMDQAVGAALNTVEEQRQGSHQQHRIIS